MCVWICIPVGAGTHRGQKRALDPPHWSYRWIWTPWCPGMLGSKLQSSAKAVFLTSEPASPYPGLLLVMMAWFCCEFFAWYSGCQTIALDFATASGFPPTTESGSFSQLTFSQRSSLSLCPLQSGLAASLSHVLRLSFAICLIWGLQSPSFLIYPKRRENKSLRNCLPEIPSISLKYLLSNWAENRTTGSGSSRSASATQWVPGLLLHAHRVPGLHTSCLDIFAEQSEAIPIADLLGGKSLYYFWENF